MMNDNVPLINVVIPYYNPPFNYFQEAIESVLSQSYLNWEVIIVNDGSNEQSKKSLERYIKGLDEDRIRIIHLSKNNGPAYAKNVGIQSSTGEIVTFLDADDIHLPWYYQEIVETFINKKGCNVLVADSIFLKELWKMKKKIYLTKSFSELFDVSCNPCEVIEKVTSVKKAMLGKFSLKRKIFKKFIFDDNNFFEGDLDLILQILSEGNFKFGTISKPCYLYRLYPSRNRASHNVKLLFQDAERVISKYEGKKTAASKYIEYCLNNLDHWKFTPLTSIFLRNRSLCDYLLDTFSRFKSTKDRIKSIKFLMWTILSYEILVPTFGISFNYLSSYLFTRNNLYKELKNIFLNYLTLVNDKKKSFYAEKMFDKLFGYQILGKK